ncbi:hypothetical protein K438DRAFT_1967820 [Mycena galopus ATCC 62051]|nr:hypothetical protein K438DRAFT_1967820 [Mycena galopus ATCC 62051]
MPPIHVFQDHDERLAYEAKFANSTERLEWEDKFGAPVGPFEYEEGPEPAHPARRRHHKQGRRPPKQELATGYRGHEADPSSESSISSSTPSQSGRSSTLLYNASLAFNFKYACKYTDIQVFIDHYERLLLKHRISSDQERCDNVLQYCTVDTQNVIRALDGFQKGKWKRLRKELLQAFDADRVFQKYKPVDVERYVAKKQQQVCHNLTQWREYFVKFHKIAGGPLAKGHLKPEDYNAYFFIGVHPSLRQLLETRILLANPRKRDREQYTVKEINDAAEGHFRRDRHEAMMVRSAELGEDRDEDYSGEDSDSDSESEGTDSEYEAFKRAKKKGKEKAKKKKQDQKKKTLAKKSSGSSETQKYQGNEEEIARLITKLSKMSLDDKDYAPIYYKVMVMDQKGVAEKCVRPPVMDIPAPRARPPSRTGTQRREGTSSSSAPSMSNGPATYPNNIPLGSRGNGSEPPSTACYGCGREGHRISECEEVSSLIGKGVIGYDPDSRKLVMKNGARIWRRAQESLVQAAERIAAENAPRVMLGFLSPTTGLRAAVQSFYHTEERGRFEEFESDTSSNLGSEVSSSDGSSDPEDNQTQRVYLTAPRQVTSDPYVQPAERTETSIKKSRKVTFDGVYPPRRERGKPELRDLQANTKGQVAEDSTPPSPQKTPPAPATSAPAPNLPPPPLTNGPPRTETQPAGSGRPGMETSSPRKTASRTRVANSKSGTLTPNIRPMDAQKIRSSVDGDIEMMDEKDKKHSSKKATAPEGKESRPEEKPVRNGGRQSELSGTVDMKAVMNRILDTEVQMTVREVMVASKDLRTELQDLIKVKNVRAVLLGNSQDHPLIANLGWPRCDGLLIKVDMKTNGHEICAIIDTGSQLDVVRADVAALKVGRAVDMSQITNMNDANGGTGQLQGWIQDVEFTCGAAVTVTDLWVSHQAPFALLLGRPWQRGNLVSIDERMEGTYLIFKDRETRRPRFELLAVPYDGPPIGSTTGPINQYASFMLTTASDSPLENSTRREAPEITRIVGHAPQSGWRVASNGRVEKIHHDARAKILRQNRVLTSAEAKGALERWSKFTSWAAAGNGGADNMEFFRRSAGSGGSPSQQSRWQEEHRNCVDSGQFTDGGISVTLENEKSQQQENIKKQSTNQLLLADRALTLLLLPMPPTSDSTNTSTLGGTRFPLVLGHPPPFQYLSRAHFPHGPMPAVTLNPQGPVAAIAEAVAGAWRQQDRNKLMALSPTFTSSPQAVYYGRTVLPGGQILHRSTSMNTFRVFQDAETGTPVTMTGHEFTFHLACPEEPQTLWNLEAPYPTDAQMQEVMRRFVPPMVSGAVALTFPMHGTEEAPPLMSMGERLCLDTGPAGRASAEEFMRDEPTTIGPHQLNAANLAKLPRGLAEARQVIADFEDQLYRRASEELQLDDDFFITMTYHAGESNDSSTTDGSIPDLVSMSSDGGGSNASIHIGFCDMCLAPQHSSELACPLFGKTSTEGSPGTAASTDALLGEQRHDQDWTNLIQEDVGPDAGSEAGVVAVFNKESGKYEVLEAQAPAIGEGLDREAPTSPGGGAAFRTLVDAAVQARGMLEDFTTEFDEELRELQRNGLTMVAEDADQITSGVRIRPATPFSPPSLFSLRLPSILQERNGTPEPEDRHSDDGTPILRRRASAPPSHADHVTRPVFTRRGRVVTRDHWSSSPASLPGGPLYNLPENEHMTLAERVETTALGDWSPAVSEEAWGWPSSYPPSYATDSNDPSSTSSESDSGFSCTSRYDFYDDENSDLQESLSFWVREGNEHQRDHRRFENEMGVEPLHQALQALHRPLSFFVNYLAMAGQGVKDIISTAFSPSPYYAPVFPVETDTESNPKNDPATGASPSPSAAPTSLDHSLHASVGRSTATPANLATSDGEWEEITVEPLSTGSRKRKHPDGEEGGLNQQGRRKKTRKFHGDSLRRTVIKREAHKAAGMADERAIRLMAGVRLAVLEALRRIEDMVWHRYGITEYAFPDKLIRHPFLLPTEAAKLQVLWHVLQRNGRDILADALHGILSIRLHKDYAVSAFFNAESLDENYPERNWEYWHLLGEEHPQSIYLRNFDISDNSSDSGSMGGLEYPPSEGATPSVTDNGAVPGHHEPCCDLHGAGPVTLTITLRNNDAVPVE